jgi:peptide/nickel transport system substrate-binding protein
MSRSDADIHVDEAFLAAPLTRRKLLVSAGASGLALAGAGFLGAAPAAAARRSRSAEIDTFTVGHPEPVEGLDAIIPHTISDEAVTANSIEALLVYDAAGRLRPALAQSWKQTDPTTYVFQIRRNVTFWDGSPMTMEDVLFSLDRLRTNKKSIFPSRLTEVASWTQTGPMELTIKMKRPSATFPYVLVFAFITQKKYTEANEEKLGTPTALGMGTGPYQFTEYVPEDHISWTRYDGYWGPKPSAKKVVWQTIKDENARLLAMRSGSIDVAFDLPAGQLSQYVSLSNTNVVTKPGLQLVYFSFCVTQKPWSDVHVRRALAHCFDKKAFVKSVLKGNGRVEDTVVPLLEWVNVEPNLAKVQKSYNKLPHYAFDLAAARRELKQSSVPNGFTATFPVVNNEPDILNAALILAQNAKKIGINLKIKEVTNPVWVAGIVGEKTKTGIQIIRKGPSAQDASDFPMFILRGSQAIKGAVNTANYHNKKLDALLAAQDKATSAKVRSADILKVLEIANTDVPYIPLYSKVGTVAVSKKLVYDGFHPNWWVIQPWAAKIRPA